MAFITSIRGLKPVYAEVFARMGVMTLEDYIRVYERRGLEIMHEQFLKNGPGLPVDKFMISEWYQECRRKLAWGPGLVPAKASVGVDEVSKAPDLEPEQIVTDDREVPEEAVEESVEEPTEEIVEEVDLEVRSEPEEDDIESEEVDGTPAESEERAADEGEDIDEESDEYDDEDETEDEPKDVDVFDAPEPLELSEEEDEESTATAPVATSTKPAVLLHAESKGLLQSLAGWIQSHFKVLFVVMVVVIAVLLIALIVKFAR